MSWSSTWLSLMATISLWSMVADTVRRLRAGVLEGVSLMGVCPFENSSFVTVYQNSPCRAGQQRTIIILQAYWCISGLRPRS